MLQGAIYILLSMAIMLDELMIISKSRQRMNKNNLGRVEWLFCFGCCMCCGRISFGCSLARCCLIGFLENVMLMTVPPKLCWLLLEFPRLPWSGWSTLGMVLSSSPGDLSDQTTTSNCGEVNGSGLIWLLSLLGVLGGTWAKGVTRVAARPLPMLLRAAL